MPNQNVEDQLELLERAKHLAGRTTAADQNAITIFAALLIAEAIRRASEQIAQAISQRR